MDDAIQKLKNTIAHQESMLESMTRQMSEPGGIDYSQAISILNIDIAKNKRRLRDLRNKQQAQESKPKVESLPSTKPNSRTIKSYKIDLESIYNKLRQGIYDPNAAPGTAKNPIGPGGRPISKILEQFPISQYPKSQLREMPKLINDVDPQRPFSGMPSLINDVDPSGYRMPASNPFDLDKFIATKTAKKPKIVTGRFGKTGIVPGDQPFTGGRGYIDPGTGMYFDTPESYRNYAMRQMQKRYWDERQGRWIEGAPTGPGAMPGIVDNARPPIMPGQPSFDPGIVTKMNEPPINSPYS